MTKYYIKLNYEFGHSFKKIVFLGRNNCYINITKATRLERDDRLHIKRTRNRKSIKIPTYN